MKVQHGSCVPELVFFLHFIALLVTQYLGLETYFLGFSSSGYIFQTSNACFILHSYVRIDQFNPQSGLHM